MGRRTIIILKNISNLLFYTMKMMIPDYKDGPSNTLLEVIRSSGGKAPLDWRGFRELTEK